MKRDLKRKKCAGAIPVLGPIINYKSYPIKSFISLSKV